MKRILVLAAVVGATYFANAQVGIGTPTPITSTQLDVTATDKGILIPRVELTSIKVFEPIKGAQAESLLVYNINEVKDNAGAITLAKGFYYWSNNEWNRIIGKTELNTVIENLGDNITTIEGDIANLQEVINFILPSNPSNEDTAVQTHTTVVYEGGKFYTVSYDTTNNVYTRQEINFEDLVQGVETNTMIVSFENKQYYLSEAYITGGGEVDASLWNSVPAGAILLDVVGGVTNNLQEILGSTVSITINTAEGDKTFTTVEEYLQYITQFSNGNVIYTEIADPTDATKTIWTFQYWDESTSSYKTIDLKDLVQGVETNTMIVSFENKQYYLSEAYITGGGEVDASLWNSVPAGAILLDVVGGVTNNLQEILGSTVSITINTAEGDKTFTTVEEYLQYITQFSNGNVIYTEIADPTDATKTIWTFQYWDESTSSYKTIDLKDLVQGVETNTMIVSFENKQYYLSEAYITGGGEVDASLWNSVPAGAILLDVVGGVTNNLQEILGSTVSITINTAEGDKTFTTVEEYLQYITQFSNGNVIYTEIADPTDATKTIWTFQYWDESTSSYKTIDLKDLVQGVETKTQIKRSEVITDATLPTFDAVRTAPVAADVKAGQIFYEYSAEGGEKDYINLTGDILTSINNNVEVQHAITHVLNEGGNVYFGDHDDNANTPPVFYQIVIDASGKQEKKEINIPADFLVNMINKYKDIIKQALGDIINNNGDTVFTGNVYNGHKVYLGKGETTISVYSAVATPVSLNITEENKKIKQVLSIKLLNTAGHIVTSNTTDIVIVEGKTIQFNIGVGNQYTMLPAGNYEVVVEYTSNEVVTQ